MDIAVNVAGIISGQGNQNDTVNYIPPRGYQVTTTASLIAAKSAVYTCNVTVNPDPGVMNVVGSKKTFNMLNITIGEPLVCP